MKIKKIYEIKYQLTLSEEELDELEYLLADMPNWYNEVPGMRVLSKITKSFKDVKTREKE